MPLGDDRRDELGKCFRHLPLNEECASYSALVEEGEHEVRVAQNSLGDRRFIVDTRLIPVLDVDRERGDRLAGVGRARDAGLLEVRLKVPIS